MATDYTEEKLIAGPVKTQQVKLAADTYYKGMPLEYDADNDRYKYLSTVANLAGFFNEVESRAVEANGWASIIAGGDISEEGIVTDANAAYTLTEDLIAAWAVRGFYIKRA